MKVWNQRPFSQLVALVVWTLLFLDFCQSFVLPFIPTSVVRRQRDYRHRHDHHRWQFHYYNCRDLMLCFSSNHITRTTTFLLQKSLKQKVDELDWVVIDEYRIPLDGLDLDHSDTMNEYGNATTTTYQHTLDIKTIERLQLSPKNVTVPVALHVLDTSRFSSLSKARKAVRQGKIDVVFANEQPSQERGRRRARIDDRVTMGDMILRKETRQSLEYIGTIGHRRNFMNSDSQSAPSSHRSTYNVPSLVEPHFNLEVVFEDKFMAIVNKPAGVLVYAESGKGRNNVLYALPYVLWKPCIDVENEDEDGENDVVLDQPIPVHRLDFATSGLLVIGKTKNAVRRLSQQFEYRKANKTYTAMVYGIPTGSSTEWNLAKSVMDEKECITKWKLIDTYQYPINIDNSTVSLPISDQDMRQPVIHIPISTVELKPTTGRYHQLRRQMAYLYNTPMVGDPIYTKNATMNLGNNYQNVSIHDIASSNRRYHRGLMLCSNRIQIEHPFYNTKAGRKEWNRHQRDRATATTRNKNMILQPNLISLSSSRPPSSSSFSFKLYEYNSNEESAEDEMPPSREVKGTIIIDAQIKVPEKFDKFRQLLDRMSRQGTHK